MSYGLVTLGPSGEQLFSSEDRSLRLVHYERVAKGFSGYINIPDIDPGNTVAYCTTALNYPYRQAQVVTIEFGRVKLTQPRGGSSAASDLMVFRYK